MLTAHRLAVLVGAGLPPATAWRHAGGVDPPPWVASVAEAASVDPGSIADAIQRSGRTTGGGTRQAEPLVFASIAGLAAIWQVSTESGAPAAPSLRIAASALRDAVTSARAARIALAGPRATARLVTVMPAVAVAFGMLLGYDTLGVLVGAPIGWGCTVLGVSLLLLARLWSRRIIAVAAVREPLPGLDLELLAIAVSGGGSLAAARSTVDAAMLHAGLGPVSDRADAVIALATAVGAPVTELLRAEADELRRRSAADAAERAAALETSLMLPLGACVLPAFVVLGVVPLLVAVMSSTVASI